MGSLAFSLVLMFAPGLVPGDYCNDRDARRVPWSAEAKAATRDRVGLVLDDLEVGKLARAFHQLVIRRESFGGESSVWHTLGADAAGPELGLGAYGLSLWWMRRIWPGDDEDPAFCTPEVSAVVAHEIMWRAVTRYRARNLVEVQAVFAGAFKCSPGSCLFTLDRHRHERLCARAAAQGVDCKAPLTEADLGRRLGPGERRGWALARARAWVASVLGR